MIWKLSYNNLYITSGKQNLNSDILLWPRDLGQRAKKHFFLKVGMLHLKLKGMKFKTICKQTLYPYTCLTFSWTVQLKLELEHAVDEAPSQIPMLKFLTPSAPQVPPLRHDTDNRMKTLFNMFCIFYLWEHSKSLVKNLWNWHGNRNLMIFDLLTHSKVTSLTLGWKFYLHSVLLIIPVDLICHMPIFDFFTPWAPQHPKVPPLGHDCSTTITTPILYL